MPHLSLMKTGLPVRPCKKGLGFTSTCKVVEWERGGGERREHDGGEQGEGECVLLTSSQPTPALLLTADI